MFAPGCACETVPVSLQGARRTQAASRGLVFVPAFTKLMNDQTKSQRKATIHQKEEKAKTRMLWLLCKTVSQLGCVSQDSEALFSQNGKQSR